MIIITLSREKGEVKEAAKAVCKESGIVMEVFTDLPGMQFYIGNFIDHEKGKGGHFYERSGFCIETQYLSGCLQPGELPVFCVEKR